MKNLLVPTDFSEQSENAFEFAIKIAEKTGAKIHLFHGMHAPVVSPDAPYYLYDNIIQTTKKAKLDSLEKLKEKIIKNVNIDAAKIQFEYIVKLGFAVEEIKNIVDDKDIDLIVMGTNGASGVKKIIFGTNTASVINNARCAVLAIPASAKYRELKNIMLATDFHALPDENLMSPLKELAFHYGASTIIFNVKPERETIPSFDAATEGLRLENRLKELPHDYIFSTNDDIIEGIEDYIDKNNPDLLVMFSHKHSFWENIFRRPYTSDMAFQTHIPLLVIPHGD